jgi:hypothetical protein
LVMGIVLRSFLQLIYLYKLFREEAVAALK